MRTNIFFIPSLSGVLLVGAMCSFAAAQENQHSHNSGAHHEQAMHGAGPSFIDSIEQHQESGTDAAPLSTPSQMLMTGKGSWMFMLHGEAFLNDIQQSGGRGAAKFFSTNWIMPMAQRKLGPGTLTVRTMLSLEPATVSQRRYPELFQQGETAYGKPIIDGQHPHDFIMEMAGFYDVRAGENALLSFYGGARGDPALGPAAYPHRMSASEDPIAPLGHHLEDSTHIADSVITAGLTYRNVRVEGSGFHGREPDEYRWDLNPGKIDSWSTRLTVIAGRDWSFQYSIGDLHSPEAIAPGDDVRRMTASVTYNKPIAGGNWSSMLLWGRNQSLTHKDVGNGYLVESSLQFLRKNSVWTRIENVDRTNELLPGTAVELTEHYFARVQAYTGGYDREIASTSYMSLALGGQVTFYGVPKVLRPAYGTRPVGGVIFLRVRTQ